MAGERRRRAAARHFARHFGEMLLAMLLGMAVLGGLTSAVLALAGSSGEALEESAPAAVVAGMSLAMTAPMLGWMHYRGHSRRALVEMSGAMLAATLGALALLAAGATDASGALVVEHVAMIAAMLAVMLWRRDEYVRRPARRR